MFKIPLSFYWRSDIGQALIYRRVFEILVGGDVDFSQKPNRSYTDKYLNWSVRVEDGVMIVRHIHPLSDAVGAAESWCRNVFGER